MHKKCNRNGEERSEINWRNDDDNNNNKMLKLFVLFLSESSLCSNKIQKT